MDVQIHQQKGEIVAEIDRGHFLVEFQRIEGQRRALEQTHIGQMQIAMAATDMALRNPLGQKRAQFGQPGLHRRLPGRDPILRQLRHPCGGQIATGDAQQGVRVGRSAGGQGGMHGRDHIGHPVEQLWGEAARLGLRVEKIAIGHACHAHHMVDHPARAAQFRAVCAFGDGNHVAIQRRRPCVVEVKLSLRRLGAGGGVGEIDEGQAHRFAQLPHRLRPHEHRRERCFDGIGAGQATQQGRNRLLVGGNADAVAQGNSFPVVQPAPSRVKMVRSCRRKGMSCQNSNRAGITR